MKTWICATAMAVGLVLSCGVVLAQEPKTDEVEAPKATSITLDDALAQARKNGPVAGIAEARVIEAEGLRPGASFYPRRNPTLEASVGPYIDGSKVYPSFAVGLSQSFDLGGGVGARTASVEATVEKTKAEAKFAAQESQREAGLAFLRALWARERSALLGDLEKIAEQSAAATKKRVTAGDATAVEESVASAGVAKARAARRAAIAELAASEGKLKALIGLSYETKLAFTGTLADYGTLDVKDLLARASRRPDLLALAAEQREAEADLELGDALAFPELTIGASYELEQPDVHRIMGTFAMTLPFADRAQGVRAQAKGKQTRVEIEARLKKARVTTEVRAAMDVYARRVEALDAYDSGGVSGYAKGLGLATRGFEAGEVSLSELLATRRELADAQLGYLDAQLDVAVAALEARAAAGALP